MTSSYIMVEWTFWSDSKYEGLSGILGLSGMHNLTLLHSERPKLYAILAFLSAIGLSVHQDCSGQPPTSVITYLESAKAFFQISI